MERENYLEKFKREIEENEKLLTQPPEHIYSRLLGFVKLWILLEELKLNKEELKKYAKSRGKETIVALELTDFPPDIAEKITEKMYDRLKKAIEKMKKIYNEALQLNDKIEEVVLELEKDRYSPFEMDGKIYNGDVFYSWINDYVENEFGKDIDEQLALLIFCEIADRLRRDGYYVHG